MTPRGARAASAARACDNARVRRRAERPPASGVGRHTARSSPASRAYGQSRGTQETHKIAMKFLRMAQARTSRGRRAGRGTLLKGSSSRASTCSARRVGPSAESAREARGASASRSSTPHSRSQDHSQQQVTPQSTRFGRRVKGRGINAVPVGGGSTTVGGARWSEPRRACWANDGERRRGSGRRCGGVHTEIVESFGGLTGVIGG